jgi:hypothetical protein
MIWILPRHLRQGHVKAPGNAGIGCRRPGNAW